MFSSCVKVDEPVILKRAALFGAKEFVQATVNPAYRIRFPFPTDYKFTPCFLPKKYERLAERIENFRIRSDDIWIVTFPKAGTTWTVNIVWQLMNNLDFTADYQDEGYMYLENGIFFDLNNENDSNADYKSLVLHTDELFDSIDNEVSPRLIKSHLPAHLLPKDIWNVKPKLIYVYRDAKDVAISMYHMFRNDKFLSFEGSMEEFFDLFLNDNVIYSPFCAHVNDFQKLNHLGHVLLLSYDDMISNQFGGVKQIAEFLGYTYTDDQLKQLTEHVSFENMRKSSLDQEVYYENDYK